MNYQPYPTTAKTPSRRMRKGMRNSIFLANKKLAKVAKKARKLQAQQALETELEAA